ncbi:hypothetical protein [Adonisia turfae]|uniref:Uncharacterized protein n=1 Tax=Adonisia turfae CCMR0081 TaxID=2292702 RepID=A0A6M0RK05_9CYAN|nr:hypothetical protein [Adonisia turfae]NEZ56499.1 hypothetical protein [Adonisia turfae CCMR0081]
MRYSNETPEEVLKNSSEPFIHDDEYDLDDYTDYDENGPYFDPYAGCYDDEPHDVWGKQDDYEYWLNECGQGQGYVGCLKAGSEECDFECPFRDSLEVLEITRLQMIERWVLDKLPWVLHAWRNLMIGRPYEVSADAEEFWACFLRSHNIYGTPWDAYLINQLFFDGDHESIPYDDIPF